MKIVGVSDLFANCIYCNDDMKRAIYFIFYIGFIFEINFQNFCPSKDLMHLVIGAISNTRVEQKLNSFMALEDAHNM